MSTTISITASAFHSAAPNAAWTENASAQSFDDSMGGAAQIHFEFVTTRACIAGAFQPNAYHPHAPGLSE